jgi:hypothetical protein
MSGIESCGNIKYGIFRQPKSFHQHSHYHITEGYIDHSYLSILVGSVGLNTKLRENLSIGNSVLRLLAPDQ